MLPSSEPRIKNVILKLCVQYFYLSISVFICKGCYVGIGHIKQTQHGANGQKVIEMTAYTMAQEEGLNQPSALQIIGCGLFKTSYFDSVRHDGFKGSVLLIIPQNFIHL